MDVWVRAFVSLMGIKQNGFKPNETIRTEINQLFLLTAKVLSGKMLRRSGVSQETFDFVQNLSPEHPIRTSGFLVHVF